jgi:hypothetical protein
LGKTDNTLDEVIIAVKQKEEDVNRSGSTKTMEG